MTKDERRKLKREAKARVTEEDLLELKRRWKTLIPNLFSKLIEASQESTSVDPGLVALLEVVSTSFSNLRAVLEGRQLVETSYPDGVPTSWAFPFVELRYPVEWRGTPLPKHDLKLEDLSDRSIAELTKSKGEDISKTALGGKLIRLWESTFEVLLLVSLTRGVYWWTGGGEWEPMSIPGLGPEPPSSDMPKAEREAIFEETFQPARILGRTRATRVTVTGDAQGESFSADLFLQVHPLIVDADREEAFYPILVGLDFESGKPETWTEDERAALWDKVFEALAELADALIAKSKKTPPVTGKTSGLSTPVAVAPSPSHATFPLPFGTALVDQDSMELVRHIHKVRLPGRRWSSFKSWEELKAEEVARLQEEEGERAFRDLKRETGDPDERGPLLKKRVRPDGTEIITLTAEGELRLKLREGLAKGLRYVDPKNGKEYLVRLFQAGQGYVEVGLSWFNLAGPWAEGWRNELRDAIEAERRRLEPMLFDDLERAHQERIDRLALQLQVLEDGRRIMEAILGQVGRQGRNPVRIPAVAFRTLLKLEGNPHWKSRVESALEALRACEFRLESHGTATKMRGRGNFIGAWTYQGAGPGGHGEGDYFISVVPDFLGCLAVFQSGKRKLPSGLEVTEYAFGKKLTEDEKKALGWGYDPKERRRRRAVQRYLTFDAGRVFYHAAVGLTPEQENLVAWIEREITLKGDATAPGRRHLRVKRTAQDAKEPRLYGSEFCPLLPQGRRFEAALGHFRHNAETGRTLFGTETRRTATGGGRTEGLIHVLGHELPPGRAVAQRRLAIQKTLEDIKAVVVDYLGGVVAAKIKDRWVSLDEVATLSRDELEAARFFLFLPETWRMDRRKRWEAQTGWTATESIQEAERARELLREPPSAVSTDNAGLAGLPLRMRLHSARMVRRVSLRQAGELFGVSKQAVEAWERGPENKGKPIPAELYPLVLRWVETGEPPRPEELTARRTRRTGVKKAET